tara:strand:- start:303 stop:524 length:222 start_codon:yes stop_codon:yes gene_type:complete
MILEEIKSNKIGFKTSDGELIDNPYRTPCGEYLVDPKKYYGLTDDEIINMTKFNSLNYDYKGAIIFGYLNKII